MPVSLLVVEDKESTLKHVLDVLAPLHFSVDTAKDGLDGLSKAKAKHYDIVLVDHKMPVMDGFSLLKNLREDVDGYQQCPIFFMTTQELSEVEPSAIKAGATHCFSKPLQPEYVLDTLRQYIERSVA